MNGRSDQELVREYAERRSEAAFAELVRRHIDLVHSAALRMVKDSHLAEDVTQSVFVAFGQNARQLSDRAVLSGWLHRTTQNLAAKLVRTEMRRRAREQEAVAMNQHPSDQSENAWEQVAPHLDAALGELTEPDRDALLLRYFQRKPAREMAGVLGLSEEAAQKRVTRALEKLRGIFAARGVAVSTTALASLLALQAVQTAPAALAAAVATASLAAGTASTFTLLSLMASTKLKLGLAAVVAAGLVTPLVVQHQQLKQLRADNAALIEQTRELDQPRTNNERPNTASMDPDELARLRQEHLDLLRLRGEVTRLGNELRQRTGTSQIALATNAVTPLRPPSQPVRLSYKGAALATVADGATFAMGGWQSAEGRRTFLFVTPTLAPGSEGQPGSRSVVVKTKLVEFAEGELSGALMGKLALVKNRGDSGFLDAVPVFLQNDPVFEALKGRVEYQGGTNVNVVATPTVMTIDGQQAQVSVGQQVPALSADGNLEYHFQGTAIDLVPHITPDGRSISVEAVLSFVPPDGAPGSEVQPSDANVQRRLQESR